MEKNLNENDKRLLEFCKDSQKTTRMIAEHLGIAVKNVIVRLDKLEQNNLIEVEKRGVGKTTLVRTKNSSKVNKYILDILHKIKEEDGIEDKEMFNISQINSDPPKNHDLFMAITTLPYLTPKLIYRKVFLTSEGEKFLKENKEVKE